jgi:hypothetical protein
VSDRQREILEIFVEAQRVHRRAYVSPLWDVTQRSAIRRERAIDADLRRRRDRLRQVTPIAFAVTVSACAVCGGRIEEREGAGRKQHVGVQRCPGLTANAFRRQGLVTPQRVVMTFEERLRAQFEAGSGVG